MPHSKQKPLRHLFFTLILCCVGCTNTPVQAPIPEAYAEPAKTKDELTEKNDGVDVLSTLRIADSLDFGSIRSIIQDQSGGYWIGSHDEGACYYDGKNFTYFTYKDGLSSHQVRTLYEDVSGNIWFECGAGLSRWDGSKMEEVLDKDYSAYRSGQLRPKDFGLRRTRPWTSTKLKRDMACII